MQNIFKFLQKIGKSYCLIAGNEDKIMIEKGGEYFPPKLMAYILCKGEKNGKAY
jgi:hypothetical protein